METGTTGNLHSRAQLGIAPGTGTGSQTTTSTSAGGATPLVPGSPRVLQADTKAGTPGKQPTVASAGGSRLNRRVDDRPPPDRLPPLRGSDQGWLPWLRSFFFTLPAPQPAVSLLEDHKGWDIDRDPPLDRDPLQIIGAYVATPELIDLMTQDSGVPADKVDMGLVDTKAVMASMTLEDFQRHARHGPCWVQIGPYGLSGSEPVCIPAVYLYTTILPQEGYEGLSDAERSTVHFRLHDLPQGLRHRANLMIDPAPDGHGYHLSISPHWVPDLHIKQSSDPAPALGLQDVVALPTGARILLASFHTLLPAIVLQTQRAGVRVILSVRAPWAPEHHQFMPADESPDRKSGPGYKAYGPVGSTGTVEKSLRDDKWLFTEGDGVPQAGQFPLGRGPQYWEVASTLGSARWYEFSLSIDPRSTHVRRDPFFDQTRERPLPPRQVLPPGAIAMPIYEDEVTDLYAEFGLCGKRPSALAGLFSSIEPGTSLNFGDARVTFVQMAHSEDAPEAMWLRAPAQQLNAWAIRAVPAPGSSRDWLYLVPLPVPVTPQQCVALQLKRGHPMLMAEPRQTGGPGLLVYSGSLESTDGAGAITLDLDDTAIGELQGMAEMSWAFAPRGLGGSTPARPERPQPDTRPAPRTQAAGWLPFARCHRLERNARLTVTRPDGQEVPASFGGVATEGYGHSNAIWVNARTGDLESRFTLPCETQPDQSAYIISLDTHSVRRAPAPVPGAG